MHLSRLLNNAIRTAKEGYGIVFHDKYQDPQAYEALVRTFWGRGVLARHIADLFEEYLPVKVEDRYVLDLASGTGIVACELSKRNFKVCAGDINSIILEHIRLQNPEIERVICDFNNVLPFADNSFDAVTSVWANRYITKQGLPTFLSEVYRVLKLGGYFLWPLFPADAVMWRLRNGMDQVTEASGLIPIIKEKGFREVEVLNDLFYKNLFSLKLPPHTVPKYIAARK